MVWNALDGLLIFGTTGGAGGGTDGPRVGPLGEGKEDIGKEGMRRNEKGGEGPHTRLLSRVAASLIKGMTRSRADLSLMKQARRMR